MKVSDVHAELACCQHGPSLTSQAGKLEASNTGRFDSRPISAVQNGDLSSLNDIVIQMPARPLLLAKQVSVQHCAARLCCIALVSLMTQGLQN